MERGGMFEMAVMPGGASMVTPNVALWLGSSQHGNARRASAASNWVVARNLVFEPSVYLLR